MQYRNSDSNMQLSLMIKLRLKVRKIYILRKKKQIKSKIYKRKLNKINNINF